MKRLAVLACLLLGATPQDPAGLIQGLRSDDITVRERAFVELEKLGASAEADLKKLAADPDATVALQARVLLRILELQRTFSPALKKEFPDICRRLVQGGEEEWTRIYLEVARAAGGEGGRVLHRNLTRADLAPLAAPALRGALHVDDVQRVCYAIDSWRHREAIPALVGRLRDADWNVRLQAQRALFHLEGRAAFARFLAEFAGEPELLVEALSNREEYVPYEARDKLIALLSDSRANVRESAIRLLMRVGAPLPAKFGLDLIARPDPESRQQGLLILRRLCGKEQAAAILPLLADPSEGVRRDALDALREFEIDPPLESMKSLLADPSADIRQAALWMPRRTLEPELMALVRASLFHSVPDVQRAAMRRLRVLKDPELESRLLAMLEGPPGALRPDIMETLTKIAPDRAAAPIRKILHRTDEESHVRRQAFLELVELKASPTANEMKRMAAEFPPYVAAAAVHRLSLVEPEWVRDEWPRIVQNEALRSNLSIQDLTERVKPRDVVPMVVKAIRASENSTSALEEVLVAAGAESAPAMRALLKDEDTRLSDAAIWVLGRLKDVDSRPDLLSMLEDGDGSTQCKILNSLRQIGLGTDWKPIALLTESEDEAIRTAAVRTLWAHPAKEMIPAFRRLLDDPVLKNQELAIGALRELGDPELPARMKARLTSPEYPPLYVAAEYLSVTGLSGMRDPILALLEHRDHSPRWWGVSLVETAGLSADARLLLPLLDDDSLGVFAADSLISLETVHLVPDLKALLKSPHLIVRENALRALTGLGAKEAAGSIRELLSDPDFHIRLSAIRSLGILGDKAAVPALCEFAKSDFPDFRRAAVAALGRMGDPAAGPVLMKVLRESDVGRLDLVEAIGKVGYREAIPELARLWRESGEHSPISDTLVVLGARDLIPEFLRRSQADKCMGCLSRAFVALNVEEAKPLMRKRLAEAAKTGETLETLAMSLAEMGNPSGLLEYLKHPDEDVRHKAAANLCTLGDGRGVPEILAQSLTRNRDLSILNAVRRATEWKRLKGTRVAPWWSAIRRRHVERLARLAGLEVRWEGLDTFDIKAWSLETIREGRMGSDMDGCEGLSWMLKEGRPNICSDSRRIDVICSWILESGGIRVLPRADAQAFWKQWWADEQANQKK